MFSFQLYINVTMSGRILLYTMFLSLLFVIDTRDITFPPISGMERSQKPAIYDNDIDIITGSDFSGLMTFANLPYANCFTDSEVDAYDIAILGAPFDTVSTGPDLRSTTQMGV